MDIWDAAILGLIQGLTEFLPISSSGHLVLAQEVLGIEQAGAALEVAVHLGTLLSVLLWYRKDVFEIARDMLTRGPNAKLGWMVVVGTIPAVMVGFRFKDQLESALDSPTVAAIGLLATGAFLFATRWARPNPDKVQGWHYAVVVGIAQAIAILPGISRSGSTIGTAMFLGEQPVRGAKFSFLLSIVAIAGAGVLKAADGDFAAADMTVLTVSGVVAFVSGLAALAVLLRLLEAGKLAVFAPYCILAGIAALVLI